jgi:hypothetical protein
VGTTRLTAKFMARTASTVVGNQKFNVDNTVSRLFWHNLAWSLKSSRVTGDAHVPHMLNIQYSPERAMMSTTSVMGPGEQT